MKEKQPVHQPCDEHAGSSEGDKEYPTGRNILRRLRKALNEEWDYWLPEEGEGVVNTLYLTEHRVCIPEHLLSDEIVEDIISLFWYPLSAIREELKQRIRTVDQ